LVLKVARAQPRISHTVAARSGRSQAAAAWSGQLTLTPPPAKPRKGGIARVGQHGFRRPVGAILLAQAGVPAVDRSEELIEALLTLARSDRGPGPTEAVDLLTAVEDAIDLIGPAAAARQIRVDTALQGVQVPGDRVLLQRLVSNLSTTRYGTT